VTEIVQKHTKKDLIGGMLASPEAFLLFIQWYLLSPLRR